MRLKYYIMLYLSRVYEVVLIIRMYLVAADKLTAFVVVNTHISSHEQNVN